MGLLQVGRMTHDSRLWRATPLYFVERGWTIEDG